MSLKSIYKSINQFIMTKVTPKDKPAKVQKPAIIKEPKGGFPTSEIAWVEFAKKNKVKLPFFCVQGIDHTRRTSDGKPYITAEQFSADGGEWNQVQGFILKK